MKLLSRVQLFATPWTVACQAPQSMRFSRQEYWNGLLCLPPGDLPPPGIEPASPASQADSLPLSHLGSTLFLGLRNIVQEVSHRVVKETSCRLGVQGRVFFFIFTSSQSALVSWTSPQTVSDTLSCFQDHWINIELTPETHELQQETSAASRGKDWSFRISLGWNPALNGIDFVPRFTAGAPQRVLLPCPILLPDRQPHQVHGFMYV